MASGVTGPGVLRVDVAEGIAGGKCIADAGEDLKGVGEVVMQFGGECFAPGDESVVGREPVDGLGKTMQLVQAPPEGQDARCRPHMRLTAERSSPAGVGGRTLACGSPLPRASARPQ